MIVLWSMYTHLYAPSVYFVPSLYHRYWLYSTIVVWSVLVAPSLHHQYWLYHHWTIRTDCTIIEPSVLVAPSVYNQYWYYLHQLICSPKHAAFSGFMAMALYCELEFNVRMIIDTECICLMWFENKCYLIPLNIYVYISMHAYLCMLVYVCTCRSVHT